jgi:hypothetical protein
MARLLVLGNLLVALILVLPLSAADEKKTTAGSENKESPKQNLRPVGQILGEIIKMEEGGKSFTLRMHQTVPQVRFNGMYRPGGGCSS